MYLHRTPKALFELAPGQRQLNLRERSLLLLAEHTPVAALHGMYQGQGSHLVQRLLADGYLQTHAAPSPSLPATARSAQAGSSHVSLAGVRMQLFDLCERMFANRLHDTATHLRHPSAPPASRSARSGQHAARLRATAAGRAAACRPGAGHRLAPATGSAAAQRQPAKQRGSGLGGNGLDLGLQTPY